MTRPQPEEIDPDDLRDLAVETIEQAEFPMLSTVDPEGQPRLRPVSPVRRDGFTLYVANLRSYNKTEEIAENPRVELCYLDDDHNQTRITARAETVTDEDLLGEIWQDNNLLRKFFDSVHDPELIIYRMVPNRVRYMQEWALEYYEVPL
jgi:general stress protein 26